MLRAWKKKDRFEARLRAHRVEPRDAFLDNLVALVTPTRARARFRRPALAVALTVVLLGALAGLGGVSYASFKAPVTVIKKLALPASTPHDATHHAISHRDGRDRPPPVTGKDGRNRGDDEDHETSGHGEYGFKVCHHPPGNPRDEHTITVGSIAAVIAHLGHGDHRGRC
ncbi:MAG: hypothetical protein JWO17_1538 [Actinomycetia bacterium]|nr:hypothetical protein [Actinomycetes bacterium]